MSSLAKVKAILIDELMLSETDANLEPSSPLLGTVRELDSMTVVTVLTAIEREFGIVIEDDEISADIFKTVSTLSEFVDAKLAAERREL